MATREALRSTAKTYRELAGEDRMSAEMIEEEIISVGERIEMLIFRKNHCLGSAERYATAANLLDKAVATLEGA
jgi:hypothetical protein